MLGGEDRGYELQKTSRKTHAFEVIMSFVPRHLDPILQRLNKQHVDALKRMNQVREIEVANIRWFSERIRVLVSGENSTSVKARLAVHFKGRIQSAHDRMKSAQVELTLVVVQITHLTNMIGESPISQE
jgi:hypothetical protein